MSTGGIHVLITNNAPVFTGLSYCAEALRNHEADKLNPAVVLVGNGHEAKLGPPAGVLDIGECEKAYLVSFHCLVLRTMRIMERASGAAKVNPEVVVTGNGPEAKLGLPMGVVDIGVNDRAYLCRVSLPGLVKKKNDLSFEIKRDGTVIVHGVERVHELFNELQELIPPAPFTISLSLPGPVDTRLVSPQLRADGILEIIVYKMGFCPTRAD